MNKKFVILVLVILVLTSFSTITFVSPQASGSPPITGDKNFVNASFSTSYTQVQTGSNPSFSINIPSSGSIRAKANATGSTGGTGTSNVVNQTINPAAAPASQSVNTSNIHPLTTTTGYVYFNETGLPSGTSWSVLYNSLNLSSTTTSIKFSETVNIYYTYTVHTSYSGVTAYTPSPSSGSAKASSTVSVSFSGSTFTANLTTNRNPTDEDLKTWYYSNPSGPAPSGSYYVVFPYIDGVNTTSMSVSSNGVVYDGYYLWSGTGSNTIYFFYHVSGTALGFDSSTLSVTVNSDPTVSISASPTAIDYGQSVTFSSSVSGGTSPYTYQWYLNGSAVSGATSSTWTTTTLPTGNPTIYVKVTDSNSFTVQSNTVTETVNSDPTVTISSSNNPVDVNIAVTFTANPSGGSGTYSSYAWYVSSAQQSSTSSTMSYTFSSSGSYTVEVIVTDSLGFKAYYNYSETANPLLSVSLGVNLNPIDVNVQAAWSASASGGDGSYTYYFYLNGVLQSSSGSVFYYTDSSSGSYEVYVKVVDSEGEVAFYNNITETVNPTVQAYISSNVNPSSISQTFTLTANAYDGTSPYYYQWYTGTAGSGSAISGATSSTYSTSESSAGTYDFYVVVTDSGGGSITSATFQETVASVSVYITPSRSPSDQNQKVFFNATESGGSGTIYYAFYLQGTLEVNSTSPSWSTVFTSTGTYNVTVWVYATTGGNAHATNSQVVNTDPTISVSSSQITTDVGLTVTFSSSPSGGTTPYTYSWGGGTVSGSSEDITWSFTTSGNFTVSITLTDSAGYQVTASLTETVHSDPTATISSSSNPATVGYSFTLTATAALGTSPYSYQWYYNGTLISGATSSTYTTSQSLPGKYNYTAKITDNAGYSVTSSKFVETVQVHITVTLTSSLNPSTAGEKVWFNASATGGVSPYVFTFFIEIVNMTLPEQVITYSITQHQAASGVYYNSSKMYVNYTTPFSSFSFSQVDYRFSISNLTLTNPNAPVDTFNFINYTFNTFALYRHTTTYSAIAYKNTSSTTVNATFATSELVKGILKWQYSPVEYSFITKDTVISATASIPSPATMTLLSLSINGIFAGQVSGNGGNSITMSYNLSQYFKTHILSAITVQWTGQSSIGTQTITLYYSSTTHPVASSHSIIIYQSANATYQYPINLAESAPSSSPVTQSEQINQAMGWIALGPQLYTKYSIALSGVPSGTGIYQQSLTIDPATYGINSQGSNVLFYDGSNGTELYAWLESINSTSALYWLKNYDNSSTINMYVYPSGDNLFSSTGYLGEAPQLSSTYGEYDNGAKVFNNYWNFAGTSLPSGLSTTGAGYTVTVSNGVTISIPDTSGDYGIIYTTSPLTAPYVIDQYVTTSGSVFRVGSSSATTIGDQNMMYPSYVLQGAGAGVSGVVTTSTTYIAGVTVTPTLTLSPPAVYSFSWAATGTQYYAMNYTSAMSASTALTFSSPLYAFSEVTYNINSSADSMTLQWLRTRTYVSSMPTFTIGTGMSYYSVSFKESGLPSGTEWYANVTGQTSPSSTTPYVNSTLPNGTYYYNISTINKGYRPFPSAGSFAIDGANASISITFRAFTITFTETGLPSGYKWYANITSQASQSSTSPTISLQEPNGTYYYNISSAGKIYKPSPGAGSITVNGANVSISITFAKVTYTITFTESGLTSGTWYVNVSTTSQLFSEPYSTTTISFNEPNGTYSFTVQTNYKIDKPSSSSGTFTVNGASVSETITFTKVTYTITFTETGLTSGTWWANISTTSQTFSEPYTTSTISFTETNGTYSWSVSTNYKNDFPSPASGTITVNGQNASISITFSVKQYTINFQQTGLTSGNWYIDITTASQNYTMLYNVTLKSISEPNGTYHFVITASLVTASPSPASGNITVNGATVWVNITFTIEPYYLQKISITNTTILAGLNTADSNFLISTSSEVLLYTLITYASPTELNISVRTPSGTTALEIQEYEKFQSFITPTGYLQNMSTSFWTNITVPSTMPTYTFGTGTLWMANVVPQEIGGMTGTNGGQGVYNNSLDWNTYSYQIAVAPNANYITVLFNSTWIFLNTGTTLGTYIALTNSTYDFVTFYDVHGYSFITVTFVEQSTSYADFSINYYPTSAVLNEFGINLQYSDFLTYVNGNYSSSSLVPAQMGHTYNIKTYDKPYNQLISSINYTVNYPDSQVSIPINIYPIAIDNMNSSYAVGLVVSVPGTIAQPQNGTFITPGQTIDVWLPEGKYYFNYTYVGFNYASGISVSKLVNVTAPSFQIITGVTLSQIQFSQQKNAQNISNLVEAVNITFLNSNSNILNQTLKISLNIQDFNTSVKNLYLQILNNVTFLKSIVTNSTATMTDKMNFINSSLKYMDASVVAQLIYDLSAIQNMNSTVTLQNIQIMKELSTIGNQSESQYVALETTLFQATGSMRPLAYQFIAQNGTYSNGIYDLPVVVLSWQDTAEPTPVTISLLRNLTVEYIQGSSSGIPLHFTAESISQHGFMLRLSISVAQLKEIDSGSAKLLLNSNFNGTNGAGIVTSMPYTIPTTLYSFLSGYAVYFESYQGLTILMTILGLVLALMSVSIDVRSIRKMNNGGRR